MPHDVIELHGLIHTTGLVLSRESAVIAKESSQSILNALQKAFTEKGGVFFFRSKVVKLLIKNEKAMGVRLRNGMETKAKSLVVSNLSALQAVQRIGEEHLDSKIFRRVNNIRYDRHNVI